MELFNQKLMEVNFDNKLLSNFDSYHPEKEIEIK